MSAATRRPRGWALERCVGDARTFVHEHWSRRPLLRRGAGTFDDLLSLEDVDFLISSTLLRTPAFRLVKDGKPLPELSYTVTAHVGGRAAGGVADPGRVFGAFAGGATIVLQSLHRSWEPIARFVRDLEVTLTAPCQANAYITPPGAQGLAVHYDTHDVFVLQLAGTKHWRVYEPSFQLPLASQGGRKGEGELPEPLLDVEIGPGDAMYVPRGFRHAATAQEAASAHLTIGVLSRTWHDVLGDLVELAKEDARFRGVLPVGHAEDEEQFGAAIAEKLGEVREWLAEVDPRALADRVARRFWSTRRPLLRGQLAQLAALDRIDASTPVRRREGAVCRLIASADGETLRAVLGDRELRMPSFVGGAMRTVLERDELTAADLSGDLDEASALVLVQRLVREGLFEIEAAGES